MGQMYTGYITVNNQTLSKVHYTLYSYNGNEDPTSTVNSTAPLFVWLEGGPGCSAQRGDKTQIGPFQISWNGNQSIITARNTTWNSKAHLLFPEDVLGVGFSVGLDNVNSTLQVAEYLHVFLVRFFQIYPSLADQDLYLIGESYGGHFSSALGAKILSNITVNKFNFKGLVISDGLLDMVNQMGSSAQLAYAAGLIDPITKSKYAGVQLQAAQTYAAGDVARARDLVTQAFAGLIAKGGNFIKNDYRRYEEDTSRADLEKWLLNDTIKELLHVDPTSTYAGCVDFAQENFKDDAYVSFTSNLTYILNNGDIKVLIWEGQDDWIINTPGVMNYLRSLTDWQGYQEFRSAKKATWTAIGAKDKVYGAFKRSGNFTFANLNKAGHLVPSSQPESAFDLISRYLENNWS